MRSYFTAFLCCLVMAAMTPAAEAFQVTPLNEESIVVELTVSADSPEAAEHKAKSDAVRGTVGRLFLKNELLMADDILVKYIDNYAEEFVDGMEVLSDDFVAGKSILKAKVYVDFDHFEQDLREKRFIYEPAYKPRFTTFMTEILNDDISAQGVARESLTLALQNLGMRSFPDPLQTPPSSTDVLNDDFLLRAAVINSQRSGVEIIVTGAAETTLVRKDKLYFDDYFFYETELKASLVRVDTQEILASATARGSAADVDEETAVRLSLDRASAIVATDLFMEYNRVWPVVIQLESDFEILFTGIDDELINVIEQNIHRMGRDIKVYKRKQFDKSAVLSIELGSGKGDTIEAIREQRQKLIENLNSCPYPTLNILNPEDQNSFEVQVSS